MYVVLAAKASGMAASHFKLTVWENDETVIFCSRFLFLSISQTDFLTMTELMSKMWQRPFKQSFLRNVGFCRRKTGQMVPAEENSVF